MAKTNKNRRNMNENENEMADLLNEQRDFAEAKAEEAAAIDTATETITEAIFGSEMAQSLEPVIIQEESEYIEETAEAGGINTISESEGIQTTGIGYKITHKVGYGGTDKRSGIKYPDGLHIMDLKTGGERLYHFSITEFKDLFNYSTTANKAVKPNTWAELKPGHKIEKVIEDKDKLFKEDVGTSILRIRSGELNILNAIDSLMMNHGRKQKEVLKEFIAYGFTLENSIEHINPVN